MNPPSEEYGGLWDDLATARKWRPILPMLDALENSIGTIERLEAIQEILAFCIKTGLKEDPYTKRSFLIFGKIIETLEDDPEWRTIFEGIIQ
tara:strand:+ start:93 stop:368 length:276 start_codon:yes stop_codon:yes gene_type:complete